MSEAYMEYFAVCDDKKFILFNKINDIFVEYPDYEKEIENLTNVSLKLYKVLKSEHFLYTRIPFIRGAEPDEIAARAFEEYLEDENENN